MAQKWRWFEVLHDNVLFLFESLTNDHIKDNPLRESDNGFSQHRKIDC